MKQKRLKTTVLLICFKQSRYFHTAEISMTAQANPRVLQK